MKIHRMSAPNKPCAPFDLLFDLAADPHQEHDLVDYAMRAALANAMVRVMRDNDAPEDVYARLGLPKDGKATAQMLEQQEKKRIAFYSEGIYQRYEMTVGAKEYLHAILELVPPDARSALELGVDGFFRSVQGQIGIGTTDQFLDLCKDGPMKPLAWGARMLTGYFLHLERR